MSTHIEIGKKGEELASSFLKEKGYLILDRNWRHKKLELDIVAKQNNAVIFVEVKTRSYDYFGPPQDFVTLKKQKLLVKGAAAYMELNNHEWEIRFDVIAIIFEGENRYSIQHLEDAFFPGL